MGILFIFGKGSWDVHACGFVFSSAQISLVFQKGCSLMKIRQVGGSKRRANR